MGFFHRTPAVKEPESSGSAYEYIIVGLGNPDRKYEATRHNAGFMAVDAIAAKYGAKVDRLKFKAVIGDAMINDHRCLLMKPTTYMNLSGQAVVEALNFYKIPIEHVIVLFDDISLDPGKLRIRRKGSDGGHNGIKNIIYLTGKDTFPRVKIGVGQKPHPEYDLARWVLSTFNESETKAMQEAFQKCPDIVSLIMEEQIDQAMSQYNS